MKKLVLVGLVALVLIGTMVAPLSGWECIARCPNGRAVCTAGDGGGCISGTERSGCLYPDGRMYIRPCGVVG